MDNVSILSLLVNATEDSYQLVDLCPGRILPYCSRLRPQRQWLVAWTISSCAFQAKAYLHSSSISSSRGNGSGKWWWRWL